MERKRHAKLGDIDVKATKEAVPKLKVPRKYRHEQCIESKMHVFGYKNTVCFSSALFLLLSSSVFAKFSFATNFSLSFEILV